MYVYVHIYLPKTAIIRSIVVIFNSRSKLSRYYPPESLYQLNVRPVPQVNCQFKCG